MKTQNLQSDYTSLDHSYQHRFFVDFDLSIPKDDPVRLVRYCIGGMNLNSLYHTYYRTYRNSASPRQLLTILIYANMNKIYSSREIEKACRENLKYIFLLDGKPAPDHTTIARFRSQHLAFCMKEIFSQMDRQLRKFGLISGEDIFIDGTKIESAANKYTFVWKKSVLKYQTKLFAKIPDLFSEAESMLGISMPCGKFCHLHQVKNLRKKLLKMKQKQKIIFVHGKGKHKTICQRLLELTNEIIKKWKDYCWKIYRSGSRNSFSKTDPDATFMRMKEDAMKNGQLKPAYNVQYGVDSEFIVWATVNPNPTDTRTLIPFLQDEEKYTSQRYPHLVADAGYESEENYVYLKKCHQTAYIKPSNYEKSKCRKWKKDIGRMENMTYCAEKDCFICANHKELHPAYIRHSKTASGYIAATTVYQCTQCQSCPLKEQCIHGKSKVPLEQRNKNLYVSKTFQKERQADLRRITTPKGIQLRVNRSIQSEGTFADVKADFFCRRFLMRGNKNVLVETMLWAMAHNYRKLHHKIQGGTTTQHLFSLHKAS